MCKECLTFEATCPYGCSEEIWHDIEDYAKHFVVEHNTNQRSNQWLQCQKCNKQHRDRRQLFRHFAGCIGKKSITFTCIWCLKQFQTQRGAEKHINKHHQSCCKKSKKKTQTQTQKQSGDANNAIPSIVTSQICATQASVTTDNHVNHDHSNQSKYNQFPPQYSSNNSTTANQVQLPHIGNPNSTYSHPSIIPQLKLNEDIIKSPIVNPRKYSKSSTNAQKLVIRPSTCHALIPDLKASTKNTNTTQQFNSSIRHNSNSQSALTSTSHVFGSLKSNSVPQTKVNVQHDGHNSQTSMMKKFGDTVSEAIVPKIPQHDMHFVNQYFQWCKHKSNISPTMSTTLLRKLRTKRRSCNGHSHSIPCSTTNATQIPPCLIKNPKQCSKERNSIGNRIENTNGSSNQPNFSDVKDPRVQTKSADSTTKTLTDPLKDSKIQGNVQVTVIVS